MSSSSELDGLSLGGGGHKDNQSSLSSLTSSIFPERLSGVQNYEFVRY